MGVKLRIQANKSGRNSLYLDIHHKGRSKEFIPDLFLYAKPKTADEKLLNAQVKARAEQIRADREMQLIAGEHESLRRFNQDRDVIEYFKAFSKDYKAVDYRKVEASILALQGFRKVSFKEVNENFVEDFKEYLVKNFAPETARAYFSKFQKMLKRARVDGLCKYDIRTFESRFKKGDQNLKKEVLEPEEIQKLAQTPCGNEAIKWAFIFCCFTGLDFADIYLLKWVHVKGGLKKPRSKTDTGRTFQLHPTALAILSKFNRKTKYVFQEIPNRPENADELEKREIARLRENSWASVDKTLKALVKRAGIDKHITFHCARHSFGTNVLGDDSVVAALLGHSDTKTVAKYRRIKDERAKASINSLKEIDV